MLAYICRKINIKTKRGFNMRHIILTNKLKGPLGRLPRALSYHPLNILTRRHSRDDTVSTSFLYKRSCVTGVPGKHCAGMPVTTCLDESIWMQSKAHSDGSVYPVHHGAVYPAHVFPPGVFCPGSESVPTGSRSPSANRTAGPPIQCAWAALPSRFGR